MPSRVLRSLAQVRGDNVVAVGANKLTMTETGLVGTVQRPYVVTLGTENISVNLSKMPASADIIVVSAEETEATISCYAVNGQKEYETVQKVLHGQNVYQVPMGNNGDVKIIDVRLANGRKKTFKIANGLAVE